MGMWKDVVQTFSRRKKTSSYEFTDEDREKSAITKKRSALKKDLIDLQREELEHLKEMQEQRRMREKIDEIRNTMYGTPEDAEDMDADEMFFQEILYPILQQKQGMQSQTPTSQVDLSDDEIDSFLDNIPAPLLSAVKHSNPELKQKMLLAHMPGLTEQTTQRIISRVS